MIANNFDEFVIPMAEETPHAVVLDWYRRLEPMIRVYLTTRQITYLNGPHAERIIAGDAMLGVDVANAIQRMRWFRNQIAHESQPLSSNQAVAFARESLDLIGRLWSTEDARAA